MDLLQTATVYASVSHVMKIYPYRVKEMKKRKHESINAKYILCKLTAHVPLLTNNDDSKLSLS